jgi:hypothetical protein
MVARESYDTAPESTGVIRGNSSCFVLNCVYNYTFILNNTSGRHWRKGLQYVIIIEFYKTKNPHIY